MDQHSKPEREKSRPPRRTAKTIALGYAKIGLVLIGLSSLGSLFGAYHWTLEILTHFQAAYFCIGLLCVTICLFERPRIWAAGGTILLVAMYFANLFPYLPSERSHTEIALTILSANTLSTNSVKGRLIEAIRKADPDIILLQEFDQSWRIAIEDAFGETYPHVVMRARPDNFGMATLSRIPFKESRVLDLAGVDVPTIHIVIEIEGEPIDVLNFHAIPPLGATNANRRNNQLASLKEYFAESARTRIVAGDFNTTMWSPNFRRLVDEGFLHDGRVGHCLCPTWYTAPVVGALLPLDHVLYSGRIELVSLRALSSTGSDHLPLLAKFALVE